MAEITKRAKPSVDASSAMYADYVSGLFAGENLTAASPVRIDEDGLVYNAVDGDEFDGVTPKQYNAGEPVTIYGQGARIGYGSGLTPGARYYLSETAGRLEDAPVTEGAVPVAKAVSSTDIQITRSA